MDKYKIIKQLGEGTFGKVFKAVNNDTNELVAIKRLKSTFSWQEALEMNEIKSLRKLNNHPNVIKILEMVRKNEEVNIIFEYCDKNLFKEMDN